MYRHIPVMLNEAIEYLDPQPGQIFADGTLGGGGYTFEIARRVGPTGKVIATDLDEAAIEHAKLKIAREGVENVVVRQANFSELPTIVEEELAAEPIKRLHGIVLDLGLSSAQLEDEGRGFSFLKDAPLSMAFGSDISARRTEGIINLTPAEGLSKIFREFGEERYANSIARSIVAVRREHPIRTTKELVEAIHKGVPAVYRRQRIHFATRTFQALRIATNQELENLSTLLSSIRPILRADARIVVISFHSLEDRIVKQFFKQEAKECICPPQAPLCVCDHKPWLKIITKKAIGQTDEEIKSNPRSRSAKLRAAQTLTI
jgi:16S rRNA (cytosine1402-N4)-methyltransferase